VVCWVSWVLQETGKTGFVDTALQLEDSRGHFATGTHGSGAVIFVIFLFACVLSHPNQSPLLSKTPVPLPTPPLLPPPLPPFFYFFLRYWGLNSGPTPWTTLPAHFCEGFIQDRVSWTIFSGWLTTDLCLLISASSVARITGVRHRCQCPATCPFLPVAAASSNHLTHPGHPPCTASAAS
jgi:hypothetical protein